MHVAYWNSTRFELEHDPSAGWYLYVYKNGECVKDYLQDSERQAKRQATEDFDVAFSLWHEEQNIQNEDQARAFRAFLNEIAPKLCGHGADDVFITLEGVVDPKKRIAPSPELLRYIEGNCHIRAWGDRAVGDLGWDWPKILDKVRDWARRLQRLSPNS
jgi:hypothetical protein